MGWVLCYWGGTSAILPAAAPRLHTGSCILLFWREGPAVHIGGGGGGGGESSSGYLGYLFHIYTLAPTCIPFWVAPYSYIGYKLQTPAYYTMLFFILASPIPPVTHGLSLCLPPACLHYFSCLIWNLEVLLVLPPLWEDCLLEESIYWVHTWIYILLSCSSAL